MGKIELALFLLNSGANPAECFYCICMAYGEVHEVTNDAIIEFIKVFQSVGLEQRDVYYFCRSFLLFISNANVLLVFSAK
jgi:hypothetical protein